MSLRDALSIAIAATALILVLASRPGEMRWGRRPSFMKDAPPRRTPLAIILTVFLVITIIQAVH